MNIITNVLRMLFGVYAVLLFGIALIITSILYTIVFTIVSKKHAPFIAHTYISRPWAKTLFLLYGIRLHITGSGLLNRKQTYVFIGNHRSLLDIPAYAIATPHVMRFLAKIELTRIPLMGYIINKLYLSVDRKDKAARALSMEKMVLTLQDGISVFICPEGTRNKTEMPLLPFHDGAFRLAIDTQLPLAVLAVKDSDKLLSPARPLSLSPGVIRCVWSEPIITTGLTQDDLPALKKKAEEVMKSALQN